MDFKLYSKSKKMGWPKPSHFSLKCWFCLEGELHGKLHDASSLLLGHFAEVRIGLSNLLSRRILNEIEIQVAAIERPQRMVQEVVGLNPELQFLGLRDGKVLEHPQVGIEVLRSISHWEQCWPVLANNRWRGKAVPVDVLMGAQAG